MHLNPSGLIGAGLLLVSLFCHGDVKQAAFNDGWPTIPTPENSSVIVVADNMIFNGVPMKTWELKALMAPKELQQFYMTAWSAARKEGDSTVPGHLIKKIPKYTVISRVEENYLLTVQIEDRKTESSRAYLAISKILAGTEKDYILGDGFPALTGTVFINDISAIDGHKKSRTIIATSEAPLQALANFYRNAMKKTGWVEITKSLTMTNKGGAMIFQRNKNEMNITLSSNKNIVNIVAVMVDN
jgi:hypothetical protein